MSVGALSAACAAAMWRASSAAAAAPACCACSSACSLRASSSGVHSRLGQHFGLRLFPGGGGRALFTYGNSRRACAGVSLEGSRGARREESVR